MTNVGQAATAEIVSGAATPPGWLARAIGLGAVALALLSALATFLVLADLTPILPTHEVVVTLLLVNAVTVAVPGRRHRPGGLAGRPGAPARPRRPRGCMCGSSPCSR